MVVARGWREVGGALGLNEDRVTVLQETLNWTREARQEPGGSKGGGESYS